MVHSKETLTLLGAAALTSSSAKRAARQADKLAERLLEHGADLVTLAGVAESAVARLEVAIRHARKLQELIGPMAHGRNWEGLGGK